MANRDREGGARWALVVALLVGAGCGARTGLRVPRAVGIAAGYSTSAAWRDDGRVFVWGRNESGELGVGPRLARATPESWSAVEHLAEADFGYQWGCGRTNNGAVWCWGDRNSGFSGPTPVGVRVLGPSLVEELPPIAQMSIREYQACGVTFDGWVYCWGFGFGPEYPGTAHWTGRDGGVPVPDVMNAVGVAVGASHACAWRADGTATCWGSNRSGELARGVVGGACVAGLSGCYVAPAPVEGVRDIVAMACGTYLTYAVTSAGRLFAWGRHDHLGLFEMNPAPVEVRIPDGAAEVGAGFSADCARSRTGRVYCWGYGAITGTYASYTPRLIAGLEGVTDLAVGSEHACAARGDATVWCWGTNREGALGLTPLGPTPDSLWVPRRVTEVEGE